MKMNIMSIFTFVSKPWLLKKKRILHGNSKKKRLRAKQSKAELVRQKKFLYHKRYLIRSNSLVIN